MPFSLKIRQLIQLTTTGPGRLGEEVASCLDVTIEKVQNIRAFVLKKQEETGNTVSVDYSYRLQQQSFATQDELVRLVCYKVLKMPEAIEIDEASRGQLVDETRLFIRKAASILDQDLPESGHQDLDAIHNMLENLNELVIELDGFKHLLGCCVMQQFYMKTCCDMYCHIRMFERTLISSPFTAMVKDIENVLRPVKILLLKSAHILMEEQTWDQDSDIWNSVMASIYPPSSSPRKGFDFTIQADGGVQVVCANMRNGQGKVSIGFHALPIQATYLKSFMGLSGRRKLKTLPEDLAEISGAPAKQKFKCNCLSFASGRRGGAILTPSGQKKIPNKISGFYKQLIDRGCISVEFGSLGGYKSSFKNPIDLPEQETFTYLTAFVFDKGHNDTAEGDFHVYRCFSNPKNPKELIWMELALAEGMGGVHCTKYPDGSMVTGIPENPQEAFCRGSWTVFAGYWLMPYDVSFVYSISKSKLLEEEAVFVEFIPEEGGGEK